jgi:hypothetical protein
VPDDPDYATNLAAQLNIPPAFKESLRAYYLA